MPSAAKTTEFDRGPFRRLSDSEILLFVARTLRPLFDDGETSAVVAKLQGLQDILDRQDGIVADLPDGPGKNRIGETVAQAKELVAQIVELLAGAAQKSSAAVTAASP